MRETTKLESLANYILSFIGLFIPVRYFNDLDPKWKTTISIGHIPVGWIMVIIAVVVNLILQPVNIETTQIYYATFTPEGELKIEEPKINQSMGCNIYWRAKGYPCYEIKE